jgi:hypothetical protein
MRWLALKQGQDKVLLNGFAVAKLSRLERYFGASTGAMS